MQWSSVGGNNAVVGFSAMGEFFKNHPQSGTEHVTSAVSCGERSQRRDSHIGIYITLLTEPAALQQGTPKSADATDATDANVATDACDDFPGVLRNYCNCKQRLESDVDYDVNEVVARIYPCPDTLERAKADTGRFVRQNDSSCYVSGKTFVVRNISFTQQCCYHDQKR